MKLLDRFAKTYMIIFTFFGEKITELTNLWESRNVWSRNTSKPEFRVFLSRNDQESKIGGARSKSVPAYVENRVRVPTLILLFFIRISLLSPETFF